MKRPFKTLERLSKGWGGLSQINSIYKISHLKIGLTYEHLPKNW